MIKYAFFVFLFLVGCMGFQQSPYSFEDGWQYLGGLDDKYNTNVKLERMNKDFAALDKIEPFIQDLWKFRERLEQDPGSLDRKKLLWFIDARHQMLESQRFYQLALKMGDIETWDEVEVCTRLSDAEFAFKYYRAAVRVGSNATHILDTLLQDFEPAQRLLGIDETHARFYDSAWDQTNLLLEDLKALIVKCLNQ